ncbi:MAG: hypothetical protein R2784_07470 [Saprospiraceae bacterium]
MDFGILVVLTIGFIISYLVYGIVPVGNLATIYIFAGVYLLAILGFGLYISTLVETSSRLCYLASFYADLYFNVRPLHSD